MLLVGMLQEVAPRISAADLEVSQHRISVFLSTHTAYELLPESGKVWKLYPSLGSVCGPVLGFDHFNKLIYHFFFTCVNCRSSPWMSIYLWSKHSIFYMNRWISFSQLMWMLSHKHTKGGMELQVPQLSKFDRLPLYLHNFLGLLCCLKDFSLVIICHLYLSFWLLISFCIREYLWLLSGILWRVNLWEFLAHWISS